MVTLEEFIPKNYLIRKIDKAIDLNIIHERVAHLYCPDKETVERTLPLQNNLQGLCYASNAAMFTVSYSTKLEENRLALIEVNFYCIF